nr:hypothetical protein [Kocuria rhizophila]
MTPLLRHHRLENGLYQLSAVLGVFTACVYTASFLSTDWSVHAPYAPFFLAVTTGSFTLYAVTVSLVRLFHQDQCPGPEDCSDLLDTERIVLGSTRDPHHTGSTRGALPR